MALPTVKTVVNFSSGASFGQTLVLGTGILDQDVLGDAAALIVDVTAQVQNIQITRGRNLLTEQFQTGTATIVLADQLGYWNPQNTAGPYYGQLLPLRKIQISAIDPATSISYYLFSGYITSYNYRQSQDVGEVSTTTLTALDATQLLTLATVSTVTGAVAGETTGARFGRILDTIGWPSGQRDVDTGLTTVQADPGTARTASAALSTVALTEFGAFYIDAGGNVVFQDRNVTAGSIAGTPTAFSPKDMGYVDLIQNMSLQVARLMNVPAYYLSSDMNNSMTYSNVQDERRQFVSLSLAPYIHAIQDRLSMDDVTARGNVVKFDVENAFLAVNALERLAVIEKMLTLGLITVEQAMEMENLSPNGNEDAPNIL